jgi:hypothetical protein
MAYNERGSAWQQRQQEKLLESEAFLATKEKELERLQQQLAQRRGNASPIRQQQQ